MPPPSPPAHPSGPPRFPKQIAASRSCRPRRTSRRGTRQRRARTSQPDGTDGGALHNLCHNLQSIEPFFQDARPRPQIARRPAHVHTLSHPRPIRVIQRQTSTPAAHLFVCPSVRDATLLYRVAPDARGIGARARAGAHSPQAGRARTRRGQRNAEHRVRWRVRGRLQSRRGRGGPSRLGPTRSGRAQPTLGRGRARARPAVTVAITVTCPGARADFPRERSPGRCVIPVPLFLAPQRAYHRICCFIIRCMPWRVMQDLHGRDRII
jgi:hypothetical protein